MLSDESSSDSETGRFKSTQSKKLDERKGNSHARDRPEGRSRPINSDRFHSSGNSRIRPSESDRSRPENEQIQRGFSRQKDNRDHYERYPRDRHRPQRHSPIRKYSRERSSDRSRRLGEIQRNREVPRKGDVSKHYNRSSSRDRRHSRYHKSAEMKIIEQSKNIKKEPKIDLLSNSKKESSQKYDRKRSKDSSTSPDYKSKVSVVKNPTSEKVLIHPAIPIDVDLQLDSDGSEEVQPGSYYSMIPAVVKDKEKSLEKDVSKETISEESSEIDSSDDERLRAKLLNLEKELSKTRKKKHKKKHKKKCSKSKNEKERDKSTSVEVTSTTDIKEQKNTVDVSSEPEIVEVTSTQKNVQKESSEEGEITSENDSQVSVDNDPNDLRHKLKRSSKINVTRSPDLRDQLRSTSDVCGPALPPHLEKRFKKSVSPDLEGPALPPHLSTDRNIGPSIPSEMRKVLADRDVIKYESSDEDAGIGPLPAGAEGKWTDAHQRLEERALDMKIKKIDGHTLHSKEVKSREQWMLELPAAKAKIIGLEARSFRAREAPDMSDRSSWTDTPEEKARKAAGKPSAPEEASTSLQKEARDKYISKRDEEQEKEAKKHKKKYKRDESLLEIHEKKLKKKKKKEEREDGKIERRPFSRDTDLQVNRFDEAQKKSIIKKAQALDSRFSRGEAKYL